jgi:O-antigen chain-terminating methyltransferase
MTPDLLIHKLQNEIHEHSLNLSSTSSRSAYRQSKLEYVNTILNDALLMSQTRTKLPNKFARLPIFSNAKVQRLLLKIYNFLFKEQRTINLGVIQAVRESITLNQQLSEQTANLENVLQLISETVTDDRLTKTDDRLTKTDDRLTKTDDRLTKTDDRLTKTDDRLTKTESNLVNLASKLEDVETGLRQQITALEARLSVAERVTQFVEKSHTDRLRYLQTDLAQQKQLTTLLLKEQHGLLNPEIYSTPATSFLHSAEDIQSLQGDHQIDSFYSAFEDKFRGNRSLIRERLQIYLPFLQESDIHQSGDEILDIGSGRGEWLELLRDEGYQGRGLDINQTMIQQCKGIGLSIVEGDALTYLKSLPDNTLGGITGFHIVEHLPFESLIQLMVETYRVVRPNGLIIFETPNPRNVIVGSCTFYTDPTHKNPIPPEVLQFMVNYSGFEKSQILLLNPSQDIPVLENSAMADRFNELFYGCMDYAVIGTKG